MALKRFLALDIGASTIKLAEFTSTAKGDLTLVNFGHVSLDVDSNSEEDRNPYIVEALKKLISSKRFKARRVAFSVSGQVVLTRFLRLPAADEAKVRQMVIYEAAQNMPFPIDEMVWDYQMVGKVGGTDLDVALVAVKSDIIEGFNRCLEEAGLFVEMVDVAPFAIYNAILYNHEVSDTCAMVLDIGARTTNLIFIESNKIFTRSIPIAGNTITQGIVQEFQISFAEAEKLKIQDGFVGLGGAYEEPESESVARLSKIIRNVMTRLHAEIVRSINFYRSQQNGSSPKKLLLSGGTSITPYTDYFFKEKMGLEVEYFNPFKNVPIQVNAEDLEKVAHSMGELVGLGLRMATECPIEINLVPHSVTKRRQFLKKIPFLAASMLGVILMIFSWWLYYWKTTRLLSSRQSVISEDLDRLTRLASKLTDTEKQAAAAQFESAQIQEVIKARYFWLKFLADLNGRVSTDVWITELTPENSVGAISVSGSSKPVEDETTTTSKQQKAITSFEIRGLCLNNPTSSKPYKPVDDFKENMNKSDYFQDVQILEVGNPDPKDWTFAFRMRVKLKKPVLY